MIKAFSRIFLASFLILSQFVCIAQSGETKLFTDSTTVTKPKAIPVLEVVREIQIANENLKNFETRIKPKKSIKKIDSLFPFQKTLIATKQKEAKLFLKANPNKQKINNLLNKWYRFNDYLNVWQTSVNDNIQRNARILKDAQYYEETWKLTYEKAKTEGVPKEIIKDIGATWQSFKKVKTAFNTENNKYLSLESKINYQISITNNIIDELENLKSSEIYGIFYRRHAPIWKTSMDKTKIELPTGSEESGLIKFKNTIDFFKTFEHLIYLYIVIVLLIIALFRYLKKGIDLYKYDESNAFLKKSLELIYHNTWVSITYVCLIIAKFYFTNAPQLLDNIISLLILILTVPIVYKSLAGKFRNIIYVIIFFYVFNSIKTYVWFESYQYRAYLIVGALLVILTLFHFTRPYIHTRKLPFKKMGVFFVRLTPLIYVLGITSIVSNILGYTNLADISLKFCTHGSAISIVFYATLRILEGSALALVHRHFGPKNRINTTQKDIIEKKILKVIQYGVFILWVLFFLNILDQFSTIIDFFDNFLTEPYIIGSISFTIGDILSFLFILTGSFLATSFISFIIDGDEGALQFLKLPKGVPSAISLVLRYLILAFGIVFALSSLGIDLSKFNLMAGALGLGIGFGLQNIISNFVSGIILIFERPILPGDTIEVNNLLGNVNKIGVRSSSISTFDGADVVVPNNNLVSNDLINWTLSNNIKRVEILVGTTYDSDPNKVLEILLNCAKEYKETMADPGPVALFSDFGSSSLNFRLRFWVHFEVGLQAKSDVSIAVYNKFKEHGIDIPFPQQDIYIKDTRKSKED
ncbi:mechanosensitive ion channel domain-containing protein [uncultured Algibacter sp.]|uniref:mechanosensitive ion channel family protein n=1 Tax=uncultured Algibacter sp. TaxID=298659 RepID=UPI00260D94C8|nr:mechanosensitive ion channel domain-containing protein [uncultured Algibacter sp.]